jgi:hypothetical protein
MISKTIQKNVPDLIILPIKLIFDFSNLLSIAAQQKRCLRDVLLF